MRVVHLSDFHFHPDQKQFKKLVVDPLIADLNEMNNQKKIDLICFTGDLIDRGGFSEKRTYGLYVALDKFHDVFISPLLNSLEMTPDKFLFIPGNHDIDRNATDKYREMGVTDSLQTKKDIEEYMKKEHDLDLKKYEEYKIFQDSFYESNPGYRANKLGYAFEYKIKGMNVGVNALNSAWRCYDENDKGKLIIGGTQLHALNDEFPNTDFDFKLALMHHSFDFLHEEEVNEVKNYILKEFDLLMVGHTHDTSAYSQTTSLGNSCILSTAPSNWVTNANQPKTVNRNGYNIIDYNSFNREVKIRFRRYSFDKQIFVTNTDLGEGDSGLSTFSLASGAERDILYKSVETLNHIKDRLKEEANQHLVSYNTDSIAPKELNELFVWPKIVKKNYQTSLDKDGYQEKKEEESLKLDEICKSKGNLVLFSPREAGKTTLLYRVAFEMCEKFLDYKQIPIYLDLKKEASNSIKRQMKNFLGYSTSNFENCLTGQNVTLFLDNIKFSSLFNSTIFSELEELINNYPNLRVVCTADSSGDQDKPEEFLNHYMAPYFETANINYFKSSEIQNLMARWFSNDNNRINDEKLRDIVKNFHHLNIPSTPLAVSLFLWIYEKQKGFRPINNASMVQNFIERLFEKHSNIEIYSGEFDFSNKEHLLTQIALEMYRKNNPHYRMETAELSIYVQKLYERKKMEISLSGDQCFEEWVLDYFKEKGVLVTEVDDGKKYYKFKLNCFFQYYLAKNMILNEEFKKEILSEDSYLSFEDEIDYYTGLQRYRQDILELVVVRMENLYENLFNDLEMREKIFKRDNLQKIDFDSYFSYTLHKKNNLLIENIDEENLKEVLLENKNSKEDDLQINDTLLDKGNLDLHSSMIPNKIPQEQLSAPEILKRSWTIAGKVLKNSDEIEDGELKDRAFNSILISSLIFLSNYKARIETLLEENGEELKKENPELMEFYQFFLRFSLTLHEGLLFSILGTSKLSPVIRDYLNKEMKKEKKSQREKSTVEMFIALFLYIDAKGPDYKNLLNDAIKNHLIGAVKDLTFMKLSMLHADTKNKADEQFYEEKLNDLIKKLNSKNGNTAQTVIKSKQKSISNFQKSSERKKRILSLKEQVKAVRK